LFYAWLYVFVVRIIIVKFEYSRTIVTHTTKPTRTFGENGRFT